MTKKTRSRNIARVIMANRPSLPQGNFLSTVQYHIKTALLVTKSDMKIMVYPNTFLGACCALSGPVLMAYPQPTVTAVLSRIPLVFIWNWLNLWVFDLANQRLPNSVLEDAINKPWRPIPSKRLTPEQMTITLGLSVPLVILATLYIGAVEETMILIVLTWLYNDLGGADQNFFVRNLINAFGFMEYAAGSIKVGCGYPTSKLNATAYQWILVIGFFILSTIQFQDFGDEDGDRKRGRSTMPLVVGDQLTRWISASFILFWTLFCPWFFDSSLLGYLLTFPLGVTVAFRNLSFCGTKEDKKTLKFWCLWLTALYALPFTKNYGVINF